MASNPVVYNTAQQGWTKIANSVETGLITILQPRASHKITYRVAGDPEPTLSDIDDCPKVQTLSIDIASDEPIDVYIYTVAGNDGKVTVYT